MSDSVSGHLHACQGYVGHPTPHPCTLERLHRHFPEWMTANDHLARWMLIRWLMRRPLPPPSRWAA